MNPLTIERDRSFQRRVDKMFASALTPDDLIAFEKSIADEFNAGHIKAPIHLSGGNEQQLIDIFKEIRPNDWVCTNWRSHYHCLLRGVPPEQLKADILVGKSITLNYPEHRIISSAIVGGVLPIALGIALAIKRLGDSEKVFVFVGDMTARGGAFQECIQYACCQQLPIFFVLENNGLSVCSDTRLTWGDGFDFSKRYLPYLMYSYEYNLSWPHSGAGIRVNF